MQKGNITVTKKFCIGFLSLLMLVSCTSTPVKKKAPTVAPVLLQQELKTARTHWQNRDAKKALGRLNRILEQYPNSDVADDAGLLMGDIYFEQSQYEEAYRAYDGVARAEVESAFERLASLRAARCLLALQRLEEAEPYIAKVIDEKNASIDETLAAQELRYEVLSQRKQNLESLHPLIFLISQHPLATKKDRFRQLAFEIIEGRLSDSELQEVADDSEYGFLQAPAKFRYALIMADQKKYQKARGYLGDVITMAPDSDLSERAQMLAQQIDARQKVDPRTIGVVLPLSGKQAAIGYKALHGIQHGLGIHGRRPTSFRLAVIDSEGNPDVARRAIERLVLEDNVIGIIGGLLSKTATAEASKANEFGVPIITMSQKTGITQVGDFVFRNAMTSQMQIQRLVEIAMGQYGLARFAVVYPNDAYGVEFANLFWDEVRARGGSVQGIQPYDPKETDFRGHIQRLVGTYYLEDRDDYNRLLKEWKEKNPSHSAREGGPTPENILPPIVDFEAVFIPDSAKAVGQIAPMLAYNDVNNVRLLGTNIWNSKALIERSNKFVENAIFVDSFLSTDRGFLASEFFNSFKQTFGEDPGVFEVMGHDSAFILRQLLAQGETSRLGLTQRMAQIRGLPGALGPLLVSSEREVRRPVVGLVVKEGAITPLASQAN